MAQKPQNRRRKPAPTTQGVVYLGANLSKRECRKRLQWLFLFMQQDTAAMTEREFVEWMFRALKFLYGDGYDDPEELRHLCDDTPHDRDGLRQLQLQAAVFLDSLNQDIQRSRYRKRPALVGRGNIQVEVIIKDGVSYIKPVLGLCPSFRNASLEEPITGSRRPLSKAVPLSNRRRANILKEHEPAEGELPEFIMFDRAFDLDIWRSLSIAVGAILNAYGVPRIRQCPTCRAYFMYTAARDEESRLCRSCDSKRNTTEWRRRNPEHRKAYNKYQNNRYWGIDEGGPAAIRDRQSKKESG